MKDYPIFVPDKMDSAISDALLPVAPDSAAMFTAKKQVCPERST